MADLSPSLALLLQLEWGADESLARIPIIRLRLPDAGLLSAPEAAKPAALARHRANRDSFGDGTPDSMEMWRRDLAASDGAGLAATVTHLVFPAGPHGRLLVLGEAPGPDEDRSGHPFVGPAGQLVRKMLASIDIATDEAQWAYVVPWRPPGGRPANEGELAACLPFLHRLVRLSQPPLILALGSLAARALIGATPRRRRWAEASCAPIPVLPTAAPAVLLQQPAQKGAAWADLRMLRRRMANHVADFTNT